MSVDKFGRHQSAVKVRRVAKRFLQKDIGFKVTDDGYVDMNNKPIRNLGEPTGVSDAVPLNYMQDHCLISSSADSVDVRNKRLVNVSKPIALTDAVNKIYVDYKFLQYAKSGNKNNDVVIDARDHHGNLSVSNRRLTEVAAPLFDDDAVTLRFLQQNTVFKVGEIFNVSGRKLVNVADSTNDTEAVNLRQLNSVKRYMQKELHKAITILHIRIEEIVAALYKLHGDAVRDSVKANISVEASSLIRRLDTTRGSEEYDWRSLFKSV